MPSETPRPDEWHANTLAGHEPVPEPIPGVKTSFISCYEHVEVVYSHDYRCSHCGFVPPRFGCAVKMREHLRDEHGIVEPPDAYFWMSGYSDGKLKETLSRNRAELSALRDRVRVLEETAKALLAARNAALEEAAVFLEKNNATYCTCGPFPGACGGCVNAKRIQGIRNLKGP